MVKVLHLLIKPKCALGFIFGVRAQTEMKIWCAKGMHLLKVVSSGKKLGFKGSIVGPFTFTYTVMNLVSIAYKPYTTAKWYCV